VNDHWSGDDDPYNPVMAHGQHGDFGQGDFGQSGPRTRRHSRRSRRLPWFRLGVTGAGLTAVALAAVVGIGSLTGGQTACSTSASAMSLSALSSSALSSPSLAEQSGAVSGTATHYVLTGLPNCSYPSPPANNLFVALSPSEYDGAAACGGYLTVTGPDGSVTVQVIDQCPECAAGHIDLSEPAFAELAPLGAGLINVHYQHLTDPPLPGPITMEVKSGSSQYWLALLAGNTGNPLASVQVKTASGGWLGLARASYNYWIAQSGAGAGPFTVRLTDIEGNQVTLHNVALDPGAVQSTGVYMYGAGSDPAPAAAAAASATPRSAVPTSAAAISARTSSPVSPAPPSATGLKRVGAAPAPQPTAAIPSATC
jgi:expansin (peptidoglycan-binding protein)